MVSAEMLALVIKHTLILCGVSVTGKVKLDKAEDSHLFASSVLPEFSEASGIISELPLPSALDDNVSWRESVSSIPETSRSHDHKENHRLMPMEGEIWHYDQRKSRNCGLLCYKDKLKHE